MAKVVMLTALCGEGIDIVAGDVCECSSEQANRFVAFGYARELKDKEDDKRTVKSLGAPAKKAEPPENSTPKPTRKRGKKETTDANT